MYMMYMTTCTLYCTQRIDVDLQFRQLRFPNHVGKLIIKQSICQHVIDS